MRAIPIEPEWVVPGARRVVIAAPNGDLTDPDIPPLEVVLAIDVTDGTVSLSSIWVPDDEERAAIAAGGVVVLTVGGAEHPVVAMTATTADGFGQ